MLYAIVGDYLATVDPVTGSATEVAPLTPGFTDFSGLTYEPNLDQLMAVVDRRTDPRLVSIDRCSGDISVIGFIDRPTPFLDIKLVEAMEYNPSDGLLYASGYEKNPTQNWFSSRRLMTVDPQTGNATIVASVSGTCQNDVDGMAFTANTKYVVDGCPNPKRLYTINLNTGSATLIGSFNLASGVILAVHPTSGALFSTTNGGGRELYSISNSTGTESLIGSTHTASDFAGGVIVQMAFAPSPDQDGDGFTVCEGDCDDTDPAINPAAIDLCDNIDNDCDGQIDEDIDPDPVASLNNLIALIEELVQNEELAANNANPLITKLELVISKFTDKKIAPASGQLNGFNMQLVDFISDGTITPETGDILLGIGDCLAYSLENGDYNLGQPSGGVDHIAYGVNSDALLDRASTDRPGFQLFPNPTQGNLTLDLANYREQAVTIAVFNSVGREVFRLPEQVWPAGQLPIDLTARSLPAGLYFLAIQTSSGRELKQFVLNR